MDGLDLLKQHWNKDGNFPKIDKEEIKRMLYKSSSSIVKWIFIISVIELAIGIVLSFCFITTDLEEHVLLYDVVYNVYNVIFYTVILFFIYKFFYSYRDIRNTNNTKVLLETILNTRKHVNNYIKFNIYCITFAFILVSIEKVIVTIANQPAPKSYYIVVAFVVIILLFYALFLYIVRLYYKFLYQRLVHKLNNNYEELIKIDEQA